MKRKISAGALITVGVLAVLIAYVGYYYFLYSGYSSLEDAADLRGVRSGAFGDAFGALNALFSGLAFSGVLITLYFQRKDLKESHIQNAKQQTESQFYNMLALQQQVVQGFDLHPDGSDALTIQGRDCFRSWRRKMQMRYVALNGQFQGKPDIDRGVEAFNKVYRSHQGDLGLYFRSLYSVFRFLDGVDPSQRKLLGGVIRSLLSDYELVFIFYNCLGEKGRKFNRYAVEYALFDNLDVQLLLQSDHAAYVDELSLGENQIALKIREAVCVNK